MSVIAKYVYEIKAGRFDDLMAKLGQAGPSRESEVQQHSHAPRRVPVSERSARARHQLDPAIRGVR
jgi:hypothetical protein